MLSKVVLKLFQRAARVSGANFRQNRIDPTLINAKSPKVSLAPNAATSGGNANDTPAFTVQRRKTAIPIAKPRIVIGKISEGSSQTKIPMKVCTNATTISIAARIR